MPSVSKTILILDPLLSQAWALSKRFKAAGFRVVGCFDSDDKGVKWALTWQVARRRVSELRCFADFNEQDGTIVPTGSFATSELVRQNKSITIGEILYDPANIVFFDKCNGQSIAERSGWRVPETWTEPDAIPEEIKEVFIKPSAECFGKIRKVLSVEKTKQLLMSGEYIAQRVIRSNGVFGYGFLASNGEVLASSMHYEVYSDPPPGGSAVIIKQFRDSHFEEKCKAFIKDIKYNGWGLIECKKDEITGDYIFLELNAKFWASLEFSMRNDKRFSSLLVGSKERERAVESMWFVGRTNVNSLRAAMKSLMVDKNICLYFEPGWTFALAWRLIHGHD